MGDAGDPVRATAPVLAEHMYPGLTWLEGTHPSDGKWPGLTVNAQQVADGMRIDKDVPVTLRDGVVIYVDTYRPEKEQSPDEKLPILMTWSPYGKHGPKTFDIFPNSGVPKGSVSRYAAWEGPDPIHWTKRGYAVINGDGRGSWGCEGDCEILGLQEAYDGYDVVEWAAALPWSNGRVGLAGVSYLAITQWRIASLRPPHLACINPWEGFSDFYREYAFHGGIPETNFVKFMEWSCRCSFGKVEDWLALHTAHPLLDDYGRSKSVQDWKQVTVPAYVVADWGDQGLHTRGTLYSFSQLGSSQKWLEVHGRKKWAYYYQPSSLVRQEAFYQKFLKGESSETDHWPPVQIEVRDRNWVGTIRAEQEWPLARQQTVYEYLDAATGTLGDAVPATIASVSYNSEVQDDHVHFEYEFKQDTELTGSMRLRLWVSADDSADDMDLFVQLDKVAVGDSDAPVIPFVAMSMIDEGPLALGWLRVSHRELDMAKSTVDRPWLQHRRQLLLRPGEIVPVDIEIWPSCTRFEAGQKLRITLQGNDIFRYPLRQVQLHENLVNKGRHHIHTGGAYDSYLVLPIVETLVAEDVTTNGT